MIGGADELHAMMGSGHLEHVLTKHAGKPALPDDLAKAVERSKAEAGAADMLACSLARAACSACAAVACC
jgi:hypothetical protein